MSEGLDKREEAKEEGTAGRLTPYSQCPQAFPVEWEITVTEGPPVTVYMGPPC